MSSSKPSFFSRFKKDKDKSPKSSSKITPLSGVALAAGTSAASGAVSGSDNSAATSRNLQNASRQLDDYLKEMDSNDERIGDVISMSRFIEKAEAYSNSDFKGCVLRQVNIDPPTLLLVDLAAKCSKRVYNRPGVHNLEPFAFEQIGESKTLVADVLGGSVKATTVTLYKGKTSFTGPKGDDIRIVVVAISGTATVHDWLVNFNDTKPNSSFFNKPTEKHESEFLGQTEDGEGYQIHFGFLTAARAMAPKIASLLIETCFDSPNAKKSILIFTGHSAGGAVAALLYAHMLKPSSPNVLSPLTDHFATVHSITFGTPPVTSPALTPFLEGSTFISFVNEGDPIPRCDAGYLNSLLKLWVSPMPKGEVKWGVPEHVLENAGAIVGIPRERDENGGTLFVMVGEDGTDGLAGRVFGDPKMHKMDAYLRSVRIARVVEE